jgi:hypothetical protein
MTYDSLKPGMIFRVTDNVVRVVSFTPDRGWLLEIWWSNYSPSPHGSLYYTRNRIHVDKAEWSQSTWSFARPEKLNSLVAKHKFIMAIFVN